MNAAAFGGISVDNTSSEDADSNTTKPSASHLVTLRTARSEIIHLRIGGIMEIHLEFDPFRLDKDDREFIFDLIDRICKSKADFESPEEDSEGPPF